jgi:hypothetical protein
VWQLSADKNSLFFIRALQIRESAIVKRQTVCQLAMKSEPHTVNRKLKTKNAELRTEFRERLHRKRDAEIVLFKNISLELNYNNCLRRF